MGAARALFKVERLSGIFCGARSATTWRGSTANTFSWGDAVFTQEFLLEFFYKDTNRKQQKQRVNEIAYNA